MRRTAAFLAVAALLAPAIASHAASYDDAACRGPAVPWTNDPCAGQQWGITATQAQRAWAFTRGSGIVVAVVDTGADFSHPDLSSNLIPVSGSNLVENTAYRCPFQSPLETPKPTASAALAQDDNGHGTHVSGTIAARTGNGRGVAGLAPAARVLPVKVLDADGAGEDRDVARGICFAVDHGAKIVNLSLGTDTVGTLLVAGQPQDTNRAIAYAYSKGAAVIVAAGNEGFPICEYPANDAKALCVGSVDRRDVKSHFSNFGSGLGVVAPGGLGSLVFCEDDEDIWSTVLPGAGGDCANDGYETFAGTSMATPHVSAIAALIASRYGARATPQFIYGRLKNTADDLGPAGPDPAYGYGRVNAYRAMTQ
jgi:subtilisin family serine protease